MAKLDLTKLKGNANATKEPSAGNESVAPASSDKPAAGLAFLKNRTKPAELPGQPKAAPNPPAATGNGGLAFLKQRANQGSAGSGGSSESVAGATGGDSKLDAAHGDSNAGRTSGIGDSGASGGAPSDDLASLLDSDTGGTAPVKSRFADEIPADAPARELPEGLEKQQLQFIESLDSVYKIVHEPDLLGGVVKNIMMELSQNPEYRKLISPQDVHVMIKGMRDSMGMARIKKEESKAKRGGSKKRQVMQIDGVDDLLNSLGGDFD